MMIFLYVVLGVVADIGLAVAVARFLAYKPFGTRVSRLTRVPSNCRVQNKFASLEVAART